MPEESNGSSVKPMVEIVGEVVAAYLGRNDMAADDVPGFIATIHSALSDVDKKPSRRSSKAVSHSTADIDDDADIRDGKIRCRECEKWVAKLNIHLSSQHRMTPNEYRHKWALPSDYPMDGAKTLYRGLYQNEIDCLECNKSVTVLKMHLHKHKLTPEQYRRKWGLADDYPMVAPSYSERRSEIARSYGFGTERSNSRWRDQKRKHSEG